MRYLITAEQLPNFNKKVRHKQNKRQNTQYYGTR